jgi:SAM-dependent methyltransferase
MATGFDEAYDGMWVPKSSERRTSYGINPRLRLMRKMVDFSGKSVLDAGCGDGFVLESIGSAGTKFGMDLSKTALRRGSGYMKSAGSTTAIPFRDASFDAIVSSLVLEYVEDDVCALKEMHRCLRKGGTALVLVTFNPKLWGRDDEFPVSVRRYDRDELDRKAREAGFTVVEKRYWGFPFFRFYRSLSLRRDSKQKAVGMEAVGLVSRYRLAWFAMMVNWVEGLFSGRPWGTECMYLLRKPG